MAGDKRPDYLTRDHCREAHEALVRVETMTAEAWRLKNASLIPKVQDAAVHLERALEWCREMYPGEFAPRGAYRREP